MDRDLSKLMAGVEIKVYPDRQPNRWHAHLVIPREWGREAFDPKDHPIDNSSGRNWWTMAMHETEDGVREKICAIAGRVYARRLAQALAPITVPATVIPAPREVTL